MRKLLAVAVALAIVGGTIQSKPTKPTKPAGRDVSKQKTEMLAKVKADKAKAAEARLKSANKVKARRAEILADAKVRKQEAAKGRTEMLAKAKAARVAAVADRNAEVAKIKKLNKR